MNYNMVTTKRENLKCFVYKKISGFASGNERTVKMRKHEGGSEYENSKSL